MQFASKSEKRRFDYLKANKRKVLKFQTKNTLYTLVDLGDGAFTIQGHPKYCPIPTKCQLMYPVEVGNIVMFNTYEGAPVSKWVQTTKVLEMWNE